jgi:hypothetical protein
MILNQNFQGYNLEEIIGAGAFGTVFRAFRQNARNDREEFAIKAPIISFLS